MPSWRRIIAIAALALVCTVTAGCGDRAVNWSEPGVPGPDGTLDVTGFNAYLVAIDEEWERGDAAFVARRFLGVRTGRFAIFQPRVGELATASWISYEGPGEHSEVLVAKLRPQTGPSAAAEACFALVLDRLDGEPWRLTSARRGTGVAGQQWGYGTECADSRAAVD